MTPPGTAPAAARATERAHGLRKLAIAFADYDRTRPLIDGRAKAEGLLLDATTQWVGDFCTRPVYEDYDAAEMSLSWYVAARERGEPCIAIPVFPLRDPILAFAYVRTDSGIAKPSDLIGKRIGAQGYRYTVNLWLRGIFEEHYGLAPEQARWVTCEPEGAGYVVPKGIAIELRRGQTPAGLLKEGAVDAILCPRVPKEFQNRELWIRRLFPDCRAEIHRYVARVGFVPVSHTIVLREELAEREPWVAQSLFRAFVDAQSVADEVVQTEKMVSYVDSMFLLEDQQAVYGTAPFAHGLGAANNRENIATFLRYAQAQGYIARPMAVDELFAPSTLAL